MERAQRLRSFYGLYFLYLRNGLAFTRSSAITLECRFHSQVNNQTMADAFESIEKLERDLWEAADNLRANSKLTSSDYFMPVLGVIFLRHAANRFDAAHRQIEADQASGKMPKRKVCSNVSSRAGGRRSTG